MRDIRLVVCSSQRTEREITNQLVSESFCHQVIKIHREVCRIDTNILSVLCPTALMYYCLISL